MDFRLCVSAPFFRFPPSPGLPILALDLGRRRRRTKCLFLSLAPSSAFCPRCQTPEFPEEIAERREGLEEKRVARVERGSLHWPPGAYFHFFWRHKPRPVQDSPNNAVGLALNFNCGRSFRAFSQPCFEHCKMLGCINSIMSNVMPKSGPL